MRVLKPLILMSVGGLLYVLIELLFRGYSHWTMFIVGGICFWCIGLINEVVSWEMPLWLQCLIGMFIITTIEFISGCIINLWLKWNVWDYSLIPLNVLGQICLSFMLAWYPLSAFGIIFDDYLRYWMWGEEKPHYKLFRGGAKWT